MQRAYSLLTLKRVDEDARVITGIATTPTPDRLGDIVEPDGAEFKLPIPLLYHHDSKQPIGHVTRAKVTKGGIEITAQIAKSDVPGALKDRLDDAWQSIKTGLVRGLSIGFKALETSRLEGEGFALRFIRWMWLELSAVTIPANSEATIQTIKSLDAKLLAASGREQRGSEHPGATGQSSKPRPKEAKMRTIADQISDLEEKRAPISERMEEINPARDDLSDGENQEFDNLVKDLDEVDGRLNRLRAMQRAVGTAKSLPSPAVVTRDTGSRARGRKDADDDDAEKPAPGIRFARYVKCLGMARGNRFEAAHIAEQVYKHDRKIAAVLKAAVPAGTSTHATWAGPLVGDETSVFADFVAFLRPQTVLGRFGLNGIPSLRMVPFRTALIGQTTGGQGYWVGQGKAKPLTQFAFERTTLEPLKVANIAVATDELLRDSSPAAETIIRDQLASALRERLDIDFIDPANAGSAGVTPASITNGVTPIPSSGNDADAIREDIRQAVAAFVAANNPPTSGVWIMSSQTALAVSLLVNALGQTEFQGITMNGGTLFGLPVIVSEYVPFETAGSFVFLVNASDIYTADEGGIAIDMSREASLQMDDAPTNASDSPPAPTTLVSLWQTNSVGFRAERTISWKRRRVSAVAVLSAVNWGLPSSP